MSIVIHSRTHTLYKVARCAHIQWKLIKCFESLFRTFIWMLSSRRQMVTDAGTNQIKYENQRLPKGFRSFSNRFSHKLFFHLDT